VDGVVGPQTLAALGIASATGRSGFPRVLVRIAQCESGGNPRAVSAGGRYRGKYQFSRSTWRELGAKGDPARAPESDSGLVLARAYTAEGVQAFGLVEY
jgi:hypothetical protein